MVITNEKFIGYGVPKGIFKILSEPLTHGSTGSLSYLDEADAPVNFIQIIALPGKVRDTLRDTKEREKKWYNLVEISGSKKKKRKW